ncbi:MAG: TetR/AcrR family transcriptional regulator [Bacteroidales bacterium]|nr:TetR/AcrR family transcriptional regulator [Bacteroidales bacterium]
MNNTRQKILWKAFGIFLEKGFDSVSISDLQKEIGMGRASLYHYFKGKEDLFVNVVLECYLALGKEKHIKADLDISLNKMIKQNIEEYKQDLEKQDALLDRKISILNFYLFAFQAMKYCPGFKNEALELQKQELEQWKSVIKCSIRNGEIRKDIDVDEIAKLYVNAENGIGIRSTYSSNAIEIIAEIDKMYKNIYNLIKT